MGTVRVLRPSGKAHLLAGALDLGQLYVPAIITAAGTPAQEDAMVSQAEGPCVEVDGLQIVLTACTTVMPGNVDRSGTGCVGWQLVLQFNFS